MARAHEPASKDLPQHKLTLTEIDTIGSIIFHVQRSGVRGLANNPGALPPKRLNSYCTVEHRSTNAIVIPGREVFNPGRSCLRFSGAYPRDGSDPRFERADSVPCWDAKEMSSQVISSIDGDTGAAILQTALIIYPDDVWIGFGLLQTPASDKGKNRPLSVSYHGHWVLYSRSKHKIVSGCLLSPELLSTVIASDAANCATLSLEHQRARNPSATFWTREALEALAPPPGKLEDVFQEQPAP